MSNKKEIWKAVTIDGKKPSVPYMISNHGRFGVLTDGKVEIRNFKPTAGNYRYNTRQGGKNRAIFLYKEVAKAFLKKPSARHNFIIHKDHNYLNDHMDNLKWATHEEHRAHTALSPRSVEARKRKAITKSTHSKVLDERKVTALKKMIWDPERKLSFKQLAAKFGVSEMQIYRIKTGEFWYHIRVENEPLHPKHKQNLSNIVFHEKQEIKQTAEKEKLKAIREAQQRKREEQRKKQQAEVAKRRKLLEAMRARSLRERALASARFRRAAEIAKTKKIKDEREKAARNVIKRRAQKSKNTKTPIKSYTVTKLSAKRKK